MVAVETARVMVARVDGVAAAATGMAAAATGMAAVAAMAVAPVAMVAAMDGTAMRTRGDKRQATMSHLQ